jgi:hypothetical protein
MVCTPFGLLYQPRQAWTRLAENIPASLPGALVFPLILAVLPAVAWYYGTTKKGWAIGSDDVARLTPDSALTVVILFYLAMVTAVIGIGAMLHWMSQTYGAQSTLAKGITITGFTATPLFVTGAVGFYPLFLLDMLIGLIAVCYAVYLLYLGIPIVMKIPEERGFLFASAVVAVCLVFLIVIMGATVILWDLGATPTFTD